MRHESEVVPQTRGKGLNLTASALQGTSRSRDAIERTQPGLAYPGNRLPTFSGSHTALGHSAAFPVGLPAWFIRAFTDEGDTVFDPFSGSGSTIIASENTGRVGYGMELSAIYTDVIVRRWQNVTGDVATLEGDGRTFEEIAVDRLKG